VGNLFDILVSNQGLNYLPPMRMHLRSSPSPRVAMSQCRGAIHRTQYVMSDKSDRYSMLYGNFKKQDHGTVCEWRGDQDSSVPKILKWHKRLLQREIIIPLF
jgi:hypothetical protein